MLGWLATFAVILRVLVVGLPMAATFVIVTALAAGYVESTAWRCALAAAVALGVPVVLRERALVWLEKRKKQAAAPSLEVFLALGNLTIALLLATGFADDTGRALRRHGDWFLGEKNGAVARRTRATIAGAAGFLEQYDPHPALARVVLPPPRPPAPPPLLEPVPASLPPELDPASPPPDLEPIVPPEPVVADWFHPLMGPDRALPKYASCRFGAHRDVRRPAECQLGHCGVDIGSTIGEPVLAVHDGKIDRINRNPNADAISGIFIILSHQDGAVRSRYIHLDSVREDLRPGMTVSGGEIIGRLGRTGIKRSAAHLHFGLSVRERGRETYLDPEPYLHEWRVVQPDERNLVASGTVLTP